jgi:hypothetical protein
LASSEIVQNDKAHEIAASNVTASMATTILASSVTPTPPIGNNLKTASKSMIQTRKDYSYKYATQQSKVPSSLSSSSNTQHEKTTSFHLDISQKQPNEVLKTPMSINKGSSIKGHPYNRPVGKEPLRSSLKPNISILERYNYNKSNLKVIERENLDDVEKTKPCAIDEVVKIPSLQPKVMVENLDTANILKVPIGAMLKLKKATESESPSKKKKKQKKKKKEKREREDGEEDKVMQDQVKVVVSQKVETPTKVKQESSEMSSSGKGSTRLKKQTLSSDTNDSQNINKINNKINIIFQLNDRKNNIILHRRVPKKMTKITIKEANNNVNSSSGNKAQGSDSDAYEATTVPEKSKILCTIQTQTDDPMRESTAFNMNVNSLLPYDDITEHLFFEDDILICLQRKTISFFQYHRLGALLKKGETDFRLIDRIERRVNDVPVDNDNKYQRLCYNDGNSLPIYVEMRAKQKELEDPLNCPIAFVYCNVYYIDQRNGKFSSVHLDTVKSVFNDICYATLPKSPYFIMAWSEYSPDTKRYVTGIVKYKLTPNLDLAKLAR